MTPDEYCQQKASYSGSSFYYSFRFLPPLQRRAMTALYAFCREVDDVVDECHDENIARIKLNWWRDEISRLFKKSPQYKVTQALLPLLEQFNLPEEYFREIIGADVVAHKCHPVADAPSLYLDLELGPGATRQLTWAQAALESLQPSFDLARQTAARSWEAERARLELLNAGQMIDIHTGDPDWDAAFAISQSAAFGLLFPPNEHLPNSSLVSMRGPDYGYWPKGDGTDYPASWNGQTPFEAYYLASILPVSPAASNLFRNFLAIQGEDGLIDGRPSLSGRRGRFLAAPLLSGLAWKFYEKSEDMNFLGQVFPQLLKFLSRTRGVFIREGQ